jgi:hypothetical protein
LFSFKLLLLNGGGLVLEYQMKVKKIKNENAVPRAASPAAVHSKCHLTWLNISTFHPLFPQA